MEITGWTPIQAKSRENDINEMHKMGDIEYDKFDRLNSSNKHRIEAPNNPENKNNDISLQ